MYRGLSRGPGIRSSAWHPAQERVPLRLPDTLSFLDFIWGLYRLVALKTLQQKGYWAKKVLLKPVQHFQSLLLLLGRLYQLLLRNRLDDTDASRDSRSDPKSRTQTGVRTYVVPIYLGYRGGLASFEECIWTVCEPLVWIRL